GLFPCSPACPNHYLPLLAPFPCSSQEKAGWKLPFPIPCPSPGQSHSESPQMTHREKTPRANSSRWPCWSPSHRATSQPLAPRAQLGPS
uniref:Uncharacterized protein n=1 Tax=Corvus moneduloides TaxID=1196302 RepID=A0A8C3D4D5_CORMO